MAWLDILDAELDQDSPFNERIAGAFRDNLGAAFNADAGAPRIQVNSTTTSLRETVTGTLYSHHDESTYSQSGTSYNTRASFVCLSEGVINLFAQIRVLAVTGFSSQVRFRKNGVVENTQSATGIAFAGRDFDMTVALGDLIEVQHRSQNSGTTAQIRNIRLRTSEHTPWIQVLTGLDDFQFPAAA